MKKFNLLAVILLVVSFTILGCSKKEVYVLESGKALEVGADIPEGTYKVEASEETSENNNYTTVIGDEDNPDAVFTSINNMVGKKVDLKKGQIVSSNRTVKLIVISVKK